MNRYDFTQPGGFPFDQGVMAFIQDCIDTAEQAASLAGPLAILSGCVTNGNTVTPGYVVINNEILPFVGGVIQPKVIIVETDTTIVYQDNTPRVVKFTRVAQFGDDGVQNNLWANFSTNKGSGVLSRLDALETDDAALNQEIAAINQNITTIEGDINAIDQSVADINTQIATTIKKLASGNLFIGDIPAPGAVYNVAFTNALTTTNYMVLMTLNSNNPTTPANDRVDFVAIRNKTVNGFTVYVEEPANSTQNLTMDWLVIAL
jgi:hypothetical protein